MVTKKNSKTKKTVTKTTSKARQKHKKAKIVYNQTSKKKDYFFPIILLVTAIIIVGFVSNGTFFMDSLFSEKTTTVIEGDQTVLATVNGEDILQAEIDEYWTKLPPQIKLELTREGLLEEFIQEKLLLQEADKKGIEVSETEVDEYIAAQLSASGLTFEQFENILAQQDTTVERMKDIYSRQLKLAKLFEQRTDENLESSKEEVEAYYAEHKEEFFSPEQVTVRHILVPVNENLDDETAQARVAEIEQSLDENENSNFCDLVSEHSGDPGSVNNCGEYTFAKGAMVQEFEDSSFSLAIGERETVKTAFGYHIIIKDEILDAGYLSLEDNAGTETVVSVIERILAEEKARTIYEAYIQELRDNSDIFYNTPEEPVEIVEETIEPEEEITGNVILDDDSQNVVVEIN